LPYAASNPADGQWTSANIYLNAHQLIPEVYEPGILNPGEEIILQVKLSPAIGAGKTIQATFSTPNGVSVTAWAMRNQPPQLVTNLELTAPFGGTATIPNSKLAATDADDPPERLIYTVTGAPTQGALSLGVSFTQVALDNGLLRYTHTGTGNDSFTFTLTDGKTTVGPYLFTIKVNHPPAWSAPIATLSRLAARAYPLPTLMIPPEPDVHGDDASSARHAQPGRELHG
jgi:hypothetical protein